MLTKPIERIIAFRKVYEYLLDKNNLDSGEIKTNLALPVDSGQVTGRFKPHSYLWTLIVPKVKTVFANKVFLPEIESHLKTGYRITSNYVRGDNSVEIVVEFSEEEMKALWTENSTAGMYTMLGKQLCLDMLLNTEIAQHFEEPLASEVSDDADEG